jgi:hypothetical protein
VRYPHPDNSRPSALSTPASSSTIAITIHLPAIKILGRILSHWAASVLFRAANRLGRPANPGAQVR